MGQTRKGGLQSKLPSSVTTTGHYQYFKIKFLGLTTEKVQRSYFISTGIYCK